jgi:translation initiation factor eIF-2B subunit alpha
MALASPPTTPTAPSNSFDIVAHCNTLLEKDPKLPPTIAAIESLIALLSSSSLTTISETLALASQQSQVLLSNQRNPIPLSAGTDLFQRYLVSSFQQRSLVQQSDFTILRNNFIRNSRLFVSRAKQAPSKIAQHSLPFFRDDSTIFIHGDSSVLEALLTKAAKAGRYFTLFSLTSPTIPTAPPCSAPIPKSTLPLHALAYTITTLSATQHNQTKIFITATAVLENGAVISSLGTHQLAMLAKAFNIPFYVAVESYKFVRHFPLGSGAADLKALGVTQRLPDLLSHEPKTELTRLRSATGQRQDEQNARESRNGNGNGNEERNEITDEKEMLEIIPPQLITALITENGIMTPADVSEELIKLWF